MNRTNLTNPMAQKPTETIEKNENHLPIEDLISRPIIAAAKGQQELTSVYIDNLMRLAYSDENDEETKLPKTNVQHLDTNNDGSDTMENCTIEAPIISLVPTPAFISDDGTNS